MATTTTMMETKIQTIEIKDSVIEKVQLLASLMRMKTFNIDTFWLNSDKKQREAIILFFASFTKEDTGSKTTTCKVKWLCCGNHASGHSISDRNLNTNEKKEGQNVIIFSCRVIKNGDLPIEFSNTLKKKILEMTKEKFTSDRQKAHWILQKVGISKEFPVHTVLSPQDSNPLSSSNRLENQVYGGKTKLSAEGSDSNIHALHTSSKKKMDVDQSAIATPPLGQSETQKLNTPTFTFPFEGTSAFNIGNTTLSKTTSVPQKIGFNANNQTHPLFDKESRPHPLSIYSLQELQNALEDVKNAQKEKEEEYEQDTDSDHEDPNAEDTIKLEKTFDITKGNWNAYCKSNEKFKKNIALHQSAWVLVESGQERDRCFHLTAEGNRCKNGAKESNMCTRHYNIFQKFMRIKYP